jgi:hypothetical protein
MILHQPPQKILPGETAGFNVWPPVICRIRNVVLTATDERLQIGYCVQKHSILAAFAPQEFWTPADRLLVVVENRSRLVALETGVDVRVDPITLSEHPEKDPCAYFIDGKGEPGRFCWVERARHHEETHRFREQCSDVHPVKGRCLREFHDGDHSAGHGLWWAGEKE